MIRSKDEILSLIKDRLGEDTSDEAISFVEDITDTINNYEESNSQNWKQKYEDNDKQWRQKYRDAFFSPKPEVIEDEDDEPVKPKVLRFEDLFKEE